MHRLRCILNVRFWRWGCREFRDIGCLLRGCFASPERCCTWPFRLAVQLGTPLRALHKVWLQWLRQGWLVRSFLASSSRACFAYLPRTHFRRLVSCSAFRQYAWCLGLLGWGWRFAPCGFQSWPSATRGRWVASAGVAVASTGSSLQAQHCVCS